MTIMYYFGYLLSKSPEVLSSAQCLLIWQWKRIFKRESPLVTVIYSLKSRWCILNDITGKFSQSSGKEKKNQSINTLTVFTRNHQQTNWPFHFLNNCVDVLKTLSWVLIWPWLKWQVEPCLETIFINNKKYIKYIEII